VSNVRGSDFKEVRHRAWRDFATLRRQTADAIAGLGFGLELAASDVAARVAVGETTPLGTALPHIAAAADFSFRPGRAAEQLASAEQALAQMTVPFAVAIYNEYLVETVAL
jgi:hypothetical protein